MATEPKPELQLEIGHVMFVDIVGYSKLLIDEQREVQHSLNELLRNTDQFRTSDSARRLACLPTGDGMALIFRDSMEAPLRCAVEVSKALKGNTDFQVRMGIHSGPVSDVVDVNQRSNVAGAGMNTAQRVMDCGDAGHILLSKRVAEDLAQYRHWQPNLHDLGECEVKHGGRLGLVNFYTSDAGNPGVPERLKCEREQQPTAVNISVAPQGNSKALALGAVALLLVLAGLWYYYHHAVPARLTSPATVPVATTAAPVSAIPEKSIAVLPFENLSSDKENAYFADGIQDEILTRLSKIADLKVISRTSTQHYKSAPENLPEIARQLGVAHILEGSVQKSADAVRVNVQLIKAANDSHLWADTFDRKLTDIFAVESEVAKAIADKLQAKLTGSEEKVIAEKPTDNPVAYDAYLRGLAFTLQPGNTSATLLGAQRHLQEAVRLDPKFALAWALLSMVEARGYNTMSLQPTAALREETRQAAETALTLQPHLGEAILAIGLYHYHCLKDYDTAVRYLEQARQFLPNSARVPESLAYVARRRNQWEQSDTYFAEAEGLDPLNVNMLTQRALSDRGRRRFPEALRKLDRILEITPNAVDTLGLKAAILQAEGNLAGAGSILSGLRPSPDDTLAFETQIYQGILERRTASAVARLQEVLAKPDPALGFFNSQLRFWLGWAQKIAGDNSGAEATWQQAKSEFESFLKDQPENYRLIGVLALTNAALGDKTAAFAVAERGLEVMPVEKDAIAGSVPIDFLARVAAQAGEIDRAVPLLEKLLVTTYESPIAGRVPVTPAILRLDPMFDPLRNDPRFQKLVTDLAPKEGK